MVDMAQAERDLYNKPKRNYRFELINELTNEIVATYNERPRFHKIEKQFPNWWDHYRINKTEI